MRWRSLPKEGDSVRVEFDPSTGLPARYKYQSMGRRVPSSVVVQSQRLARSSGIRLPYKFVIEQGGRKFAEATVSEWKLNGGLTAEELSKKP